MDQISTFFGGDKNKRGKVSIWCYQLLRSMASPRLFQSIVFYDDGKDRSVQFLCAVERDSLKKGDLFIVQS